MRTLRVILAAAAIASAAGAAYQSAWKRYRCEVEKKSVDRMVTRAMQIRGFEGERLGREAMARVRPCLDWNPSDYQTRTVYGLAAEAAGQKDLALAMYESALRLNERPELYVNVGLLQLEAGRFDEARRNLLRATEFNNEFLGSVSEELQRELNEEIQAREKRLNARDAQRAR